MKLPPELVDEIIGHLPLGDKRSLRNCSLVAKSWIFPSQKRLFGVVEINGENLQQWLDNISPTRVDLLGHVRHLLYREYPSGAIESAHLSLHDYLPSFRRLRHFTLSFARAPLRLQQIQLFSAFRYTLSDIALARCGVTKSSLVTLINYFPNLTSLDLGGLEYHEEHEQTPPLVRHSFKKLFANVWCGGGLDLVDELSKLGLRFEEVVISNFLPQPEWPDFSSHIVCGFGASVKSLRILGYFTRQVNLGLSHCRELREFETFAMYLDDHELDVISSITSTKIKKIILTHSPAFELSVDHPYWRKLDGILIKLDEQSGSGNGLEVAFRGGEGASHKFDLKKHLPGFVEKGRIVVLSREYEELYNSDEV